MVAIEICRGILCEHKAETVHLDSEGDRKAKKSMKRTSGSL